MIIHTPTTEAQACAVVKSISLMRAVLQCASPATQAMITMVKASIRSPQKNPMRGCAYMVS